MASNPIQYTSRTFLTILADINSDPELADKPEWFKRLIAGVGDVLSMINNGAANNSFLRTAFTRQAVQELCYLIDYAIPDAATSSGEIVFNFDVDNVIFPVTALKEDLTATSKGSIPVGSRRFESRSDVTYDLQTIECDNTAIVNNSFRVNRLCSTGEKVRLSGDLPDGLRNDTDYFILRIDPSYIQLAASLDNCRRNKPVNFLHRDGISAISFYALRTVCFQQEHKAMRSIGQSNGIAPWQEFDLPDKDILLDTLIVSINGETWERVDSLVFSQIFDKHYQLIWNSERKAYIRFGNGEYGAIPPNFQIMAEYSVGGGKASNVPSIGAISVYAGTNEMIDGCFNSEPMKGGDDQQSIELARKLAPGTVRSRDRFITAEDGEVLAITHGGVSQAKCIRNAYGVLSAKVVCIAIGGGNLNSANRYELQTYLAAKTIMESIDVHVDEAVIVPQDVLSRIHLTAGANRDDVFSYIRLGWKLLLSETGQEILTEYLSYGVEAAAAVINANFDEHFSSKDFIQIDTMMKALDRYGVRKFGERLDESAAIAFIQSTIRGIDYMRIFAPVFPIYLNEDGITTYGTIALEEI
jgi:hypothetical protein